MTSTASCLECSEPVQPPHRRCIPCHVAVVAGNPDHAGTIAARSPQDIDWPTLIAVAERRRIPVSRVDNQGRVHILRTTSQLRDEWDDAA